MVGNSTMSSQQMKMDKEAHATAIVNDKCKEERRDKKTPPPR